MLGSDTETPARMVLLLTVCLPKPAPGTDPAQANARWTNGSMGIFLLCDYLASLLEKQDEGNKTEATHTSRHRPHSEAGWRRSLRRIFHSQPLDLPKCDGEMEAEPNSRNEEEGKATSSAVGVADEAASLRRRLPKA